MPDVGDVAQLRLALRRVVEGLQAPLFLTSARDGTGRLFVVEKPGAIRIVDESGLQEVPFLDIQDRVRSQGSEQGLLGLAFAPDYARSGYLYVNYTDKQGSTIVSRFRSDPAAALADPGSEFRVLEIPQPATNHNGGMIAFGPDGYLWIGMGDGGAANDRYGNGQNPSTLLGKMLRLDVMSAANGPYSIPRGNPWVERKWEGRDVRDEVWAVGLRNPWRFSFDRATGDLWVADVGQNLYEEIHWVPAGSAGGLNFGWPIMEGAHCFQSGNCDKYGLEMPIIEYAHGEDGCSITGGYAYRGVAIPALAGAYLFSDYCSGKIWAALRTGSGWARVELLDTELNVSSFGEDEAGELYVLDLRGGGGYQLVAAGG